MAFFLTITLIAACLLTGHVDAAEENAQAEAISALSAELGLSDIAEVSDATAIGAHSTIDITTNPETSENSATPSETSTSSGENSANDTNSDIIVDFGNNEYEADSTSSTENIALLSLAMEAYTSTLEELVYLEDLTISGDTIISATKSLTVGNAGGSKNTDDGLLTISGNAQVQIGSPDEGGYITISQQEGETKAATIFNTTISTDGKDITITAKNKRNKNAQITSASIDLGTLKEDSIVTVQNITLSDVQVNQPYGSMNLVNAQVSLTAPAVLNNVTIDKNSYLHGSKVDKNILLTGHNKIVFNPHGDLGSEDMPLLDGETAVSQQLYNANLAINSHLEIDASHFYLEDFDIGQSFFLEFSGLQWEYLNKTGAAITDINLLRQSFSITNLNDSIPEELQSHLTILSASYTADGQNLVLEFGFIPSIPEPTVVTFSLLALAGLASRRRRKRPLTNNHR